MTLQNVYDTNNILVDQSVLSTEVIKEPVNKKVVKGTKKVTSSTKYITGSGQFIGDDLPGLHPAVGQDGGAVGKKAAAPEFHGPGQVGGDTATCAENRAAASHPPRAGL